TLALPLWNDAMRSFMQSFGLPRVMREQLCLLTINDYAYYDFGLNASQSARMLLAIPGLISRGIGLLGQAQTRWADEARPHYANLVGAGAARDLSATPATQLLGGAGEIVKASAEHSLAAQSGILPVASLSEALFTTPYNRLAKR